MLCMHVVHEILTVSLGYEYISHLFQSRMNHLEGLMLLFSALVNNPIMNKANFRARKL